MNRFAKLSARFIPYFFLLVVLGSVASRPTWAASVPQAGAISLQISPGFEGYYQANQWLPVRVTVANTGAEVQALLRVITYRGTSSGQTEIAYSRAVVLPTQSRRELYFYIDLPENTRNFDVEVLDRGNLFAPNTLLAQVTTSVQALDVDDTLMGVVAQTPSAFNLLKNVTPTNGRTFVAQLTLGDLPPAAAAWQTLDVLIFSDVDTGALSPEQQAALANWVATGGRLLVAGGPAWQKTAAGLTELLPLRPTGSTTLPALTSLTNINSATTPPAGSAVVATGDLAPQAVVLIEEQGVPLVSTQSLGVGKVFYLAVDPAFDPLKDWAGLSGLYRKLLVGKEARPAWHGGFSNLSSAQDALETLPALALPPAYVIFVFLALYVAAVGPINYLILRYFKRPEWGWFTIPALILLFVTLSYVVGYGQRGNRPTLHSLAVVQVWPTHPEARVDQAVGLFSPTRADYQLTLPTGVLARPLYDYYYASNQPTIQQADHTVFENVRLNTGEVKAFITQGLIPAPQFETNLTVHFSNTSQLLQGTVMNRSELSLKDVMLLVPGRYQRLGDFAPGQTLSLTGRYSFGAHDASLDNILGYSSGISHYLYSDDRALYRRYHLLNAVIDEYTRTYSEKVYLVGWSNTAPFAAQVGGHNAATENETVYIIQLAFTQQPAAAP